MTLQLIKHLRRNTCIWIINSLFKGTHFYHLKRSLLRICGFRIGANVRVVAPLFVTGDLSIGDNSFVGREFAVYGNGVVQIGRNCDIAPDVSIVTGSHEIGDSDHRAGKGQSYCVVVEDGCWIGARSTIMGNTTVHAGAVVACGAVVTRDVEANSVAGGVPARVVKKLNGI